MLNILKQSNVFAQLDDASAGTLAALFDAWEIHPGDILATAGDTAHTFFLLEKGRLLLAMDEGKAAVLDTPGDFIGLELLSVKGVYQSTLSVLEKGCVHAVPRQKFLEMIQEDTDAAATIMEAWQEYLDARVPFAKSREDACLWQHYS